MNHLNVLLTILFSLVLQSTTHAMFMQPNRTKRPLKTLTREQFEHIMALPKQDAGKTLDRLDTVSVPQSLVEKSQHIQKLKRDVPKTNTNEMYLPTDQKTVALLEKIYDVPQSAQNLSLSELINVTNLNHLLDIPTTTPEKILKDRLKNTPLQQLINIDQINPDIANAITHELIKQEKIDVKLMQPYQETLPSKDFKYLSHGLIASISAPYNEPHLLFFKDNKYIYKTFREYTDNNTGQYHLGAKITILENGQLRSMNNAKPANEYTSIPDSYISPNGLFCIIKYEKKPMEYNYELWDLKTFSITKLFLPSLCIIAFASDNILCYANTIDKTLSVYDLTTKTIQTIELPKKENCEIQNIACQLNPTNSNITAIIQYTENSVMQTIQKNTLIILHNNNFKEIEYNVPSNAKIDKLYIDPTGKAAYIIPKEGMIQSINIPSLSITSLLYAPHTGEIKGRWNAYSKITSTSNNELLIAKCNTKIEPFSFTFRPYILFIIPNTLNAWDRTVFEKNIYMRELSEDGKECIEEHEGILNNSLKLKTLYDDTMLAALNYLNTTKSDKKNTPAQEKLLVTLFINAILNKQKTSWFSSTQLNETEAEIYTVYVPKAIKTMLKTIRNDIAFPAISQRMADLTETATTTTTTSPTETTETTAAGLQPLEQPPVTKKAQENKLRKTIYNSAFYKYFWPNSTQ